MKTPAGPWTAGRGGDSARLFVAIRFPESLRAAVWDAASTLREAGPLVRWTPAGQLHITIRFLGGVPIRSIGGIDEGLRRAARGCADFTLRLGGVSAFPSLRRPRVLWLGAEPRPELSTLYSAVETALERCGFDPEDRAFRPHVTLGRVKRGSHGGSGPPDVSAELARAAEAVGFRAELEVSHLYLMRSRLGPAGATHTVEGEYPLGRADPPAAC
jgi:2'-5' RNA ligase